MGVYDIKIPVMLRVNLAWRAVYVEAAGAAMRYLWGLAPIKYVVKIHFIHAVINKKPRSFMCAGAFIILCLFAELDAESGVE